MSLIVQKALDFLRPHRPHRLYPLWYVSEDTRINAKQVFEYLTREEELTVAEIEEIKRLFDESPRDNRNIFGVLNWDGFTLLQHAVINNNLPILKHLIKKGCDVNAGICSLPLHLACKLGHVHSVQLLLTSGARVEIESTVCYPDEHKIKTYPDQIFCLAYHAATTPILNALIGDHVQVLQLLLHHENSRHLVKTDFLLHEALKVGAHECLRYILQRYSEQMLVEDGDGKTPLQLSLLTDTENALFLMDNGVEIKESVFFTEKGSTLHEMYKTKVTLGVEKATKFAIEHGFRKHINCRDAEGNTALHILLRHVGRTIPGNIQNEYDQDVVDSIQILLMNGADANLPNHVGESPLHAVLSDNSARQLYVSRHGQVRRLKQIIQEVCKVVEILLSHGASVTRVAAPNFTSPLYYAIRIFQSLQPDMFVLVRGALKQLFILLCQEGFNVNNTDSYGLTPFLLIINSSYKWVVNNATNITFCKTVLPFIGDIMQHFLKRNMDPNSVLSYWTRRMDQAIESNYFKELTFFLNLEVVDLLFYDQVRHLIIKLAQRGGNPNLLTFTPSYGTPYHLSKDIPKDSTISLLITRALYVQKDPILDSILETVNFFNKALLEHKRNEFFYSVIHFTNTDFKNVPLNSKVNSRLKLLSNTPRNLKEICRVSIATFLNWKLTKKCPKLPLPKMLLHYLVNFDM